MTQLDRIRLLILGLAAGDSLGSTCEFCPQAVVPRVYDKHKAEGWPFKQVGQGPFNWKAGEPTDDSAMAMCLVRSFSAQGGFDPQDIASRFVGWLDGSPPDVGFATRKGLAAVRAGTPWYEGGLGEYQRNKHAAANGSLMRNGVIAAMAESLGKAFEFSVKQSIITHYGPLPVLCCCAQSYLLWEFLQGRNPFERKWKDNFFECWTEWLQETEDLVVRGWFDNTVTQQVEAYTTFLGADFDPDSFQPFGYDFDGKDGYCLLTLQIAVWAASWSQRKAAYPTPEGLPPEVFEKAVGPSFLGLVAMIGHDSDTYGATAGPLIAAAHGGLPERLTQELEVAAELDRLAPPEKP